jgi:hypothetical protein
MAVSRDPEEGVYFATCRAASSDVSHHSRENLTRLNIETPRRRIRQLNGLDCEVEPGGFLRGGGPSICASVAT